MKAVKIIFRQIFICLLVVLSIATYPVQAIDTGYYNANNILYYDPDAIDCETSSTSSSSVTSSNKNDNLVTIYNYFLGKGLSDNQAAGIVGNIAQESGGDPTLSQGGGHLTNPESLGTGVGVGKAWGLIQWDAGGRAVQYAKKANVSGNISEIGTQLDVIWWHMNNETPTGAGGFLAAYKATTDVKAATDMYEQKMEAAGTPMMANRYAAANLALKYTKNPTTSGTSTDAASGCTCETNTTSTGVDVVIDPGHSSPDKTEIDPTTRLSIGDYSNEPEITQVWDTSQKVKSLLEAKGYTVKLTKDKALSYVSLKQRAEIANSANAQIAVSIHNTSGTFGQAATGWVIPQRVGLYRAASDTGKKTTFKDAAIATKSQDYANKILAARKKAEGDATIHDLDFQGRAPLSPGNISIVQLFSKVPWVYNEVGQTGYNSDKYAQGIANGIMASIKPASKSSSTGSSSSSTSTSTPSSSSSSSASAVGNVPAGGKDVGATLYGGSYSGGSWQPSNGVQGSKSGSVDDNGMGYDGISLAGKTAYAELDMGKALGDLPKYTKLKITYKDKSVVAEKRDIGGGGGAISGKPRAIDLWWETAKLLDMRDSSVVHVEPVSSDTPVTPVSGSASASTGCSSGAASGDAVTTAINYAWPQYHAKPYTTMKPEYKKATDEAKKAGKYIGGIQYPGVDCGGFVTRVMQNSGLDTSYGGGGNTETQLSYLQSSSKWTEIKPKSTSDMKPGDVAIKTSGGGHTYLFVGTVSGFGSNTASASLDGRAPMAGSEKPADPEYRWFRLKGTG